MLLLDLCSRVNLEMKKEAATKGGEFSSSCPACGGTDRFRVWPHEQRKNCLGAYWCRGCGAHGDSIEFCMQFLGMKYCEAVEACGGTKSDTTGYRTPSFMADKFRPYQAASEKWIDQAEKLVIKAHRAIKKHPDVIEYLHKRGIDDAAIDKFKLGYLDKFTKTQRSDWGLDDGDREMTLPSGLLIPQLDNKRIGRLKIRNSTWTPESEFGKYFCVPGGATGMSHWGNMDSKYVFVVESEMDGIAIASAAGDHVLAISAGSSMACPDRLVDYHCKHCDHLFICYDRDEAGHNMWMKWASFYDFARPTPVPHGKDIGEFVQQGGKLNAWLQKKIDYVSTLSVRVKPSSDFIGMFHRGLYA